MIWEEDPRTDSLRFALRIDAGDIIRCTELTPQDWAIFRAASKSNNISDKLSALEFLARKIEISHDKKRAALQAAGERKEP